MAASEEIRIVEVPHGSPEYWTTVADDVQRQGIGKALVEYSDALARRLGYRRMVLHARETAAPFYEKLGYAKIGERFAEVMIPHWAMEKCL